MTLKTLISITLSLLLGVVFAPSLHAQKDETGEFLKRLSIPRHINLFDAAMWTVTHDYADFKHMNEVVKSVFSFLEAAAKHQNGDTAPLRELGGVTGFKANLTKWLKDDDQAIRAFAAVLTGIAGDKKLAPELMMLIETRKPKPDELLIYDRGRAALALGLLDAKEYKPKIAALLKSENGYDRAGAISALAFFGATEFAPEIASLINSKIGVLDDDSSAIYFLVETGTAKLYKRELARATQSKFQSETAVAAMYALASIDAKEHAPDIARQLADKFRRADAAKALALLGAKQYKRRIAFLLRDDSGLVRSAAALALGVLEAKEYAGQIAALLRDKESYVAPHAAAALFLMGTKKHYPAAYPLLKEAHLKQAYLTDSAFSPLVESKVRDITERLRRNLDGFKK